MKRWTWKRWALAVVVGTTAAVGLALAQSGGGTDAPPGVPKVGDVISLKFKDGPDRQVKILKSEKQADGSYLSEVKDTKTGETFTLLDNPGTAPPAAKGGGTPPKPSAVPPYALPKAGTTPPAAPAVKTPVTPPAVPQSSQAKVGGTKLPDPKPAVAPAKFPDTPASSKLPDAAAAKEPAKDAANDKDKGRPFGGGLMAKFGKSDPSPEGDPGDDKPGLLKRVFGRKKPDAGPVPAGTTVAKPASVVPPTPAMPPAVWTTPGAAPIPTPTLPPLGGTGEPPLSAPVRPVAPPTPVIPTPVTPPSAPPPAVPAPLPLPSVPVPAAPPAGVPALPPIPVPPGGLSAAPAMPKTTQVVPAARAEPAGPAVVTAVVPSVSPATAGLTRDIDPHVLALRTELAPSQRAMAAKALAGCRHGSTDAVKSQLFLAAKNDPAPLVRAVCIEELCKLGYFDSAFQAHLQKACDDPSDDVRDAAKAALAKMSPRK